MLFQEGKRSKVDKRFLMVQALENGGEMWICRASTIGPDRSDWIWQVDWTLNRVAFRVAKARKPSPSAPPPFAPRPSPLRLGQQSDSPWAINCEFESSIGVLRRNLNLGNYLVVKIHETSPSSFLNMWTNVRSRINLQSCFTESYLFGSCFKTLVPKDSLFKSQVNLTTLDCLLRSQCSLIKPSCHVLIHSMGFRLRGSTLHFPRLYSFVWLGTSPPLLRHIPSTRTSVRPPVQ